MIALAVQDRRDLVRWLACGAAVLFVHAGVAFGLMEWREPLEEGNSGMDAITVELEPMEVPPDVRSDLPPGVEQVQADPTPDKPPQKTEEKAEPLPQRDSETMVAPTLPEPQPQPTPHEDNPPAPTTSAPQPARARVSVPTWKSQIAAILERNKRYHPEARARREQGVVQLACHARWPLALVLYGTVYRVRGTIRYRDRCGNQPLRHERSSPMMFGMLALIGAFRLRKRAPAAGVGQVTRKGAAP